MVGFVLTSFCFSLAHFRIYHKTQCERFLCMTIRVGLLIGLPVTLFVGHFRQNIK